MRSHRQNTTGGFTLIELLVVIAIIGVLSGMVMVNLQDARERARDAQRKADLKQIQNALEMYKNDQNPQTYPLNDSWRTDIQSGEYMKTVPGDPTHKQVPTWPDYTYARSETLKYTIVACLENTADQDKDVDNTCPQGSGTSYTLTEP